MKIKTDQQERIETSLIELIEISKTKTIGGKFVINFIDNEDKYRTPTGEEKKSESYIHKEVLYLDLVQQDNENDLDSWADAIARTYDLFHRIEEIQMYKLNNPIFFEAMKHRIKLEQLQSK